MLLFPILTTVLLHSVYQHIWTNFKKKYLLESMKYTTNPKLFQDQLV